MEDDIIIYKEDNGIVYAYFNKNAEDLIRLETKKFLKWQITNEDGEIVKSGNNTCCVDIQQS